MRIGIRQAQAARLCVGSAPWCLPLSDPAWSPAARAANSAALALGAPELFESRQSALLARRWTTVFGRPGALER